MLKSVPERGNKTLLIGTISDTESMDGLQLASHFDHLFEIPGLSLSDFNTIIRSKYNVNQEIHFDEYRPSKIG